MRQLPIQRYIDAEQTRPKTVRTSEERDKLRKREDMRRHVGIAKLIQQGLTRYEAEEQYEDRIGRRG